MWRLATVTRPWAGWVAAVAMAPQYFADGFTRALRLLGVCSGVVGVIIYFLQFFALWIQLQIQIPQLLNFLFKFSDESLKFSDVSIECVSVLHCKT